MTNPTKSPSRTIRGALVAVLLGGTALGSVSVIQARAAAPSETPAIAPAAPLRTVPDFADLVARVKPAVVSITTRLTLRPAAVEGPDGMRAGRPRAAEARGSGFIIHEDGTIVTNNHVVKDAKTVSVTLDDGTELPAHVVGRDARTDIAVLKVEAGRKLPWLELGDSGHIRVGEWVIAMGNPFGLGGTVTAGIVSARGRDIGSGPYDDYLQIDAPINSGNSGGPLFSQDGRVVGVNTAIFSPTGGSVGIGFAIPSDLVRQVVAELQSTGHVTRGYLGVETQKLSPAMAGALQLENGNGALVSGVQPGSPAAKSGLQPGDVIRTVNGHKITNPRELAVAVAGVKPGQTAKLDIVRDGAQQTLEVAVATMPADQTADRGDAGGSPGVGLALAPLSPDLRQQLELPRNLNGAVVAGVQPGSPAEQAGLRQGDVIVGIGNHAVATPEEAANAIRSAVKDGKSVALRVMRDGRTAFVAVDPSHRATEGGSDDNDAG